MKLKTEGTFDAAHHLEGYYGQCANVHGHMWRVVVWVEGADESLDDIGILWDFTKLKILLKKYDHQNLNEILQVNPTAENIATLIYQNLKVKDPELNFKVRVYESPKSYAEVE